MPSDMGGVVDTSLRVYGTKNLMVVNASIVPLHVRGNTMSLVYAIAEKAADMIKADRKGTVGGVSVGKETFTGDAAGREVGSWLLAVVAKMFAAFCLV